MNISENFNFRTFTIRDNEMMVDFDVASVFNVDVIDIWEVVEDYQDRFPERYCIKLTDDESDDICETMEQEPGHPRLQDSPTYAFSVVGLFMLSTVLRTPFANYWSCKIVEQYARLQVLSSILSKIMENADDESGEKEALLEESNQLISKIFQESLLSTCNTDISIMNIRKVKRESEMENMGERAEA